ncbi:MAG: hypothetical protein UZ21_OP11001000216 [Microgenomates bacterium OLB22]|nr:MAG: hypothetical protein UZ21_OP11001000216 [Microgenomates bacterium OLB22]
MGREEKTVTRRKTMTTPALYKSSDAFADMYTPRIGEFIEAGRNAGLSPAHKSSRKVALVIVDNQWDFCHPTGNLPVPGSQADVDRLIKFIYNNGDDITTILYSMDTHSTHHIFFEGWWVDRDGNHPAPYTYMTADDVLKGKWRPLYHPRWSVDYVNILGAHMIWTYHCEFGTPGWSLMPALSEAIAWHSAGRRSEAIQLMKGNTPRTEYFGIFGAMVPDPEDPNASGMNVPMLDLLAKNDLIYVAGEAKSHCVLETMKQLVAHFGADPAMLSKVRFLMDCTSSVVAPGIDFEAIAMAELNRMKGLGVQLVQSTDPIK